MIDPTKDLSLWNEICIKYAYIVCLNRDTLQVDKACVAEEQMRCLRCYDDEEKTRAEVMRRLAFIGKVYEVVKDYPRLASE
jgi:hypothetical protein